MHLHGNLVHSNAFTLALAFTIFLVYDTPLESTHEQLIRHVNELSIMHDLIMST